MVEINLLEWREKMSRYQKNMTRRIFWGVMIINILLLFVVHVMIDNKNKFLQENINQLDRLLNKIESKKNTSTVNLSLSEIRVWREMALDKKEKMKHLFHQLSQIDHQEIYFNEVNYQSNKVVFKGVSNSAEGFTDFMKELPNAHLFSVITINVLNKFSSDGKMNFIFTGSLLSEKKK